MEISSDVIITTSQEVNKNSQELSVTEHHIACNADDIGSIQRKRELMKSLWIKASDKCINVDVNVPRRT